MLDRRRFLKRAGIGATGFATAMSLSAGHSKADREQSPNEKSPAELITPQTQNAIDKALAFLSNRQVKSGSKQGAFGQTSYESGVAVTGLGGLAFMCGGNAPGEGKYGKNVNLCVDFVLRNVRDSGYIALADNSVYENMYGHGYAMLFLAEAYGMTQRAAIEEKLKKAVDLTCKCQNSQGGWRYQPRPDDADLSITVCQIMALRAARDAGMNVPSDVRTKCIDYVKRSQKSDGSFTYTLNSHSTFPMTAAGITSLYSAGIYDDDRVKKGLKWLMNHKPTSSGSVGSGNFFYGHYYAIQAVWHAGGEYWNIWYPAIRDVLVNSQNGDGSWPSSQGPEFAAAVACIILQMPNNYLPIFAA
jgi:hypothetical protein